MSETMQSAIGHFDDCYEHLSSHLTLERPEGGSQFNADPERREAYCDGCHFRVTVGQSGVEYGHSRECEHHCYGGDVSA